MKTKLDFRELPTTLMGLVRLHMLRPIHDGAELHNALEVLDAMAGHALNPEQEDYFEALSTMVEAYEKQHVPQPSRRGVGLLQHLLEANGMTATGLSQLLGRDRSLGVRILNGERRLTVSHIKNLARHFGLPVQAFFD